MRITKDHTLHSDVEGVTEWSQDRYAYKKRKRMHVVPMETPNRKFAPPLPMVFHPELYPDIA